MPAVVGERRDGVEMLPRQDFGRRHQRRLPAGLDHGRGGEQRHHGLAGADVALQQPQHALGLGEVGDDVVDRARLRRRQRVGQGRDRPSRAARPSPELRAAGGAAHGARAPARARAGRPAVRHRRAATTRRFPAATSAGSAGRCSVAQRVGEGRKAFAREPGRRPAIPAAPAASPARASTALRDLVERRALRSADRPARPAAACRDRLRRPRGRDAPSAACRRRARWCRRRSGARRPAAASPDSRARALKKVRIRSPVSSLA